MINTNQLRADLARTTSHYLSRAVRNALIRHLEDLEALRNALPQQPQQVAAGGERTPLDARLDAMALGVENLTELFVREDQNEAQFALKSKLKSLAAGQTRLEIYSAIVATVVVVGVAFLRRK